MARTLGKELVYAQAARWRDRCLLANGSALSDEALWTEENAQALVVHFVDAPDTGARGFFLKLKDQLASAPPPAVRLAAEILWLMMLFPSSLTAATKDRDVRKVWDWSGSPFPSGPNVKDAMESLNHGIGSGGMGYNSYKPFEMALAIHFVAAWKLLPADRCRALLADPWRFAEWFDGLPNATVRQFRHMLLHLLFPDTFERVASAGDKRRMDTAFAHLLTTAELGLAATGEAPAARDRRLLAVRQSLESSSGGNAVDFYSTPSIRLQWKPEEEQAAALPDGVSVISDEHTSSYAVGHRAWAIGAGEAASLWPTFFEGGYAAIGWGELGDLNKYPNTAAIQTAIKLAYDREAEPSNDALACKQFCRDMRLGDTLYIKQGRARILGVGRVTGDYVYDPAQPDYRNRRSVTWEYRGNWVLPDTMLLPTKTLTEVTNFTELNAFMDERLSEHTPAAALPAPYTLEDVLSECFIKRGVLEELIASLKRRKNIIIQGSPGVGKSFLARRLGYLLSGSQSRDNVEMVQFHQSYAYEDFMQGWRPDGKGFTLRNGIFYDFCRKAAARPAQDHVFIIDEINRGNLSKVFGELMLLVEADKRGSANAMPLTYSQSSSEDFFVPENLYIIGLMNTADRSLAMVDFALRRRFAFVTLQPAFESPEFRAHLASKGVSDPIVGQIVERIGKVNGRITNDKNLGQGFAIGHSYFCPTADVADSAHWYDQIVRDEIEPLLEEYWFDDPSRVAACKNILSGG